MWTNGPHNGRKMAVKSSSRDNSENDTHTGDVICTIYVLQKAAPEIMLKMTHTQANGEIADASHVDIYGLKKEGSTPILWIRDSVDVSSALSLSLCLSLCLSLSLSLSLYVVVQKRLS